MPFFEEQLGRFIVHLAYAAYEYNNRDHLRDVVNTEGWVNEPFTLSIRNLGGTGGSNHRFVYLPSGIKAANGKYIGVAGGSFTDVQANATEIELTQTISIIHSRESIVRLRVFFGTATRNQHRFLESAAGVRVDGTGTPYGTGGWQMVHHRSGKFSFQWATWRQPNEPLELHKYMSCAPDGRVILADAVGDNELFELDDPNRIMCETICHNQGAATPGQLAVEFGATPEIVGNEFPRGYGYQLPFSVPLDHLTEGGKKPETWIVEGLDLDGFLLLSEPRSFAMHCGDQIENRSNFGIHITDLNGDVCLIPSKMVVSVNSLGRFEPKL